MQESDFLEKYKNSETVRIGVELVLNSPDYTDEYKELILNFLGDNYGSIPMSTDTGDLTTDMLLTGGISIEPTPFVTGSVTITTKNPGTRGYLEKPKYIDGELVKAIDVNVVELIKLPPKDKPETVLKSIYDDLQIVYGEEIDNHNITREQLAQVEIDLATALAQIELLKVTVDSEMLLRASAENDSDAANLRYIALLTDFQTALQKGIKDAIERVSLSGQVEGLKAQVLVLTQQLEMLNNLVKQLQAQVEAEQLRQASSEILDGFPKTFDQGANTGWKLPQSEIKDEERQLYIVTHNDNKVDFIQGQYLNFYNFSDTESAVFNFTLVGGDITNWLEIPNTITIPPRIDSIAGRGYITLKWKPRRDSSSRKSRHEGSLNVTTSFGESYTITAAYWKEVGRKDTWNARGTIGTTIGTERT